MTILTVGTGQSIQAAINAAAPGDTIDVKAGIYTNQFLIIRTSITLQAINGEVLLRETRQPPNGKAMITEGARGIAVAINGFDIAGVSVPDKNGAAIRYEGGVLSLKDDYFHNNQEGLLAGADPNGSITINHSEFAFNGDGSGFTHNIYVGAISNFSITNSYVHDAIVGHEIKSRAANNTISGNRIFDNSGSASYSIDLPNGGNASITNNTIEQGAFTQNPAIVAYGEGGQSNPGMKFIVSNNVIVNDDAKSNARFLLDPTATKPSFTGNHVFGFALSQIPNDPSTIFLGSRPALNISPLTFGGSPIAHGRNEPLHTPRLEVTSIAGDHG